MKLPSMSLVQYVLLCYTSFSDLQIVKSAMAENYLYKVTELGMAHVSSASYPFSPN